MKKVIKKKILMGELDIKLTPFSDEFPNFFSYFYYPPFTYFSNFLSKLIKS